LTGARLAPARGKVEKILAVLRRLEDERRVKKIGGFSDPSERLGS